MEKDGPSGCLGSDSKTLAVNDRPEFAQVIPSLYVEQVFGEDQLIQRTACTDDARGFTFANSPFIYAWAEHAVNKIGSTTNVERCNALVVGRQGTDNVRLEIRKEQF